MENLTPEQAGTDFAGLLLGCYFVTLLIVLIAAGVALAYFFPTWMPLDVLK